MQKIKKEPKVSASSVNVSPGLQLDEALTSMGALIDAKANISDVAAVTGNRSNLNTTDKSNLVAAINEVKDNIPTSYNELTDKPIVKTSDNGFVIVAQGANRANKATAQNAFAEGGKTEATGTSSHAEGYNTLAEGSGSHSEGQGTQAAGIASHSEGADTYAAGDNSHAEGNGKVVIFLKQAYTQGDLTIVTDVPYPSNTEIESPRTQERVSVVSVQESQGVYICTLARAFSENIATNQPLNAYGGALKESSHAEGCGTIAASYSAHAEGYGTIANGLYAKASGEKSYALGRASETTGRGTQALNEAEHASGKYNKSTPSVTQFSVGIGADEEHRANAYEVTTDGKMYVKGVGGYDGTNVSDSSVDDLATAIAQGGGGGTLDYDDLDNIPIINTVAGGIRTSKATSASTFAFAEGYDTTATGNASHAEGNQCSSYGSYSHAEGDLTDARAEASHAEGSRTKAIGTYSHAEGRSTHAKADKSHAEGYNTTAEGENSHAEGSGSRTLGSASHSEGSGALAEGVAAHAEGYNSEAEADKSHAEGELTHAIGETSHAEGYKTFASRRSHTEGSQVAAISGGHAEGSGSNTGPVVTIQSVSDTPNTLTIITTDKPVQVGDILVRKDGSPGEVLNGRGIKILEILNQEGTSAKTDISTSIPMIAGTYYKFTPALGGAFGGSSHSEGRQCAAVGDYGSHAEGDHTYAGGDSSHAEGYSTYAQGDYSHTEGYYTQTTNASEHAEGTYNLSTPNKTLSSVGIGSGTGQTPRMNAYEVDLQGNVYIMGIGGYDGTNITGTGVKSVQEVIAELAQQITTLQGGGNNS